MTNKDIIITKFTPDRWQEFKDIRLEALSENPEAFASTFAEVVKEPDEIWQKRLADKDWIFLFAKDDQKTIGIVGGHIKHDEEEGVGVLYQLYVNRDYRGLGIGRNMLTKLFNELQSTHRIQKLKLSVFEHNKNAEALYRLLGFFETGRRDDAIETEDGFMDEILMEKNL